MLFHPRKWSFDVSALPNRFQAFFDSPVYTGLKNSLYNYRLRKTAVSRRLRGAEGLILEIGSGISPMIAGNGSVVYTDLSFSAIRLLRGSTPKEMYVVADATRLPFKDASFQSAVCSEVLEHIAGDAACIKELGRILAGGGRLVVTFPHRRCYFAIDDRYVSHYRRYLSTLINATAVLGLFMEIVTGIHTSMNFTRDLIVPFF